MVGFKIIEKNDFTYSLTSVDNKIHKLITKFYGINPEVENVLSFNEVLLDRKSEKFCQPCAFKLTELSDYVDDGEFLVLRQNEKTYIMQRVFG